MHSITANIRIFTQQHTYIFDNLKIIIMIPLFVFFICEDGMSCQGLEEVSQGPGPAQFISVLISHTFSLVLFGCLAGHGSRGPACPSPGAPGEGDVHAGARPRWHGDLLHLRAGPHHPEGRGLHGAQV